MASPAEVLEKAVRDLGRVTKHDAGASWPAYVSMMPDEPDNVVAFYDTSPIKDGRAHQDGAVVDHPGVQISIRGKTHPVTHARMALIRDAIDQDIKRTSVTTGDSQTWRLDNCTRRSGPNYVGPDEEKRRHLITLNYTLTLEQTA